MSGWTPPPNGPGEPQQPYGRQQLPYGRQPQQPYGQAPQPFGQQPPYGQQPYGQTPPPFGQPGFPQPGYYPQAGYAPQPSRTSDTVRRLTIGGAFAVAIIFIAVMAWVQIKGDGSSSYTMSTPDTAGGYSKTPDTVSAATMTALTRGLSKDFGPRTKVVTATYLVNGSDVLFIGAYGGSKPQEDLSSQIKDIEKGAPTHSTPSGGTGSAACAEITVGTASSTSPVCIWLTQSTMGMLMVIPDTAEGSQAIGWSQLSYVMRKMRPDVERTA